MADQKEKKKLDGTSVLRDLQVPLLTQSSADQVCRHGTLDATSMAGVNLKLIIQSEDMQQEAVEVGESERCEPPSAST